MRFQPKYKDFQPDQLTEKILYNNWHLKNRLIAIIVRLNKRAPIPLSRVEVFTQITEKESPL